MTQRLYGFHRVQAGLNERNDQPTHATQTEVAATVERIRLKHALADEHQRGFEAGQAAAREPSEA